MTDGMCDPVVAEDPTPAPEALPEQLMEQLIDQVLGPLLGHQRARVLQQAQAIDAGLCADDLLQPDDYPALARDPRWNYEDGVLAGMQAAQMALRAALRRRG
jgi:hypothetical protein